MSDIQFVVRHYYFIVVEIGQKVRKITVETAFLHYGTELSLKKMVSLTIDFQFIEKKFEEN